MRRSIAVALALSGALACRSAGPKAPASAPAAPPPEFMASYVGQRLILRHQGAQQRVDLARGDLARLAGDCDVGVEVKEASFAGGTATFKLEALGPAILPDKAGARGRTACGSVSGFLITVSGFVAADTPEAIQADLGKLLAPPEGYLTAKGVPFERPEGAAPKVVASQERNATFDERTLARQVKTWPKAVLRVDPFYRDPGGRVKHEGEVEFAAVVWEDGRLHDLKLRTPLGTAHEDHVLRALSMWRYEPAMAEAPVSARINGRCTFRIY
jgi:hypothetical protein